MGLDVTAYQHIATLDSHERSNACWDEEDHHQTFVYKGFERSFRNLPIVAEKNLGSDGTALLYGPCVRSWGTTHDFRAGSYGGYNAFRKTLSLAAAGVEPEAIWASPEDYLELPFFLLINFADNEGVIGPEACADLARDFAKHREVRNTLGFWYPEAFDNWAQALALAAHTGMVVLH